MSYSGQIKDFPKEVVEKMLERQFEHDGKKDVRVFEREKSNGFVWSDTIEGRNFWGEVINNKNFDLFFERYPKKEQKEVFNPQPHYDNSNGSLYQVAIERGWNAYIFDIVKRLERGGKKDPIEQEIDKSIDVLKLWKSELNK